MTNSNCTCLTAESGGEFPHAASCDAVRYGHLYKFAPVDDSDIRELAEVAAAKDIDLAVSVYRAHLRRLTK